MLVSRRDFVRASAAVPFATWFSQYGFAQASATRYDVLSPEGQAMVKKYAAAVAKMMAAPKTSPLSWAFQWYTHFVPSGNKAKTLVNVYGAKNSPERMLANDTWNTCQSHMGQPEDYFLPWHRMYLFFFESIIRGVLNDDTFTLPYWNYSATGTTHGALPAPFRSQNDPYFKVLYLPNRNSGVNSGTPIDQGQPGALDLDSLTQATYSANGPEPGFCSDIDSKLHGSVHVLVGNTTNMGQIPTAAGDPIFWMHHCNIDRLWASWNKSHANPKTAAFLAKTFVFADRSGKRVVAKIGDFLDTGALHYTYDHLETVPTPVGPHAVTGQPLKSSTYASANRISLTAQPVRVPLAKAPRPSTAPRTSGQANYYVIIEGFQYNKQPGVFYNLYLNLPDSASGATASSHRIGSINFFSGMQRDMAHASNRFVSFNITSLVQSLGANAVNGDLHVTIAPAGTPEAEAEPTLATLRVVTV